MAVVHELSPQAAGRFLLAHAGLLAPRHVPGHDGVRDLLSTHRCVQLDPLDPIGTNADLVALARVDGIERGDVYDAVFPGHAFEHFAKERCLVPAAAFPYYRDAAHETPWWRDRERLKRLGPGLLDEVLAEVQARGPVAVSDLTDRGRVPPLDWNGWKGTGRATTMAVEVLWRRCQVVVCGRAARSKIVDVPARALPEHASAPAAEPYASWAICDRVAAAGLLSRASGPHWSVLEPLRRTDAVDRLLASGALVEVRVTGSPRTYLAPPAVLDAVTVEPDDRLRILGPLDPALWDRKLVLHALGFDYVWEVYKPAEARRWGWYVCPLLHRGVLVGRIEAHTEDGALVVDHLWEEPCGVDLASLDAALARHAAALGAGRVRWAERRPRRRRGG